MELGSIVGPLTSLSTSPCVSYVMSDMDVEIVGRSIEVAQNMSRVTTGGGCKGVCDNSIFFSFSGTRGVTSTFSGCRCHAAEYGGGARDNAKKFGSGQCARNVRTAEHHRVAGVRRKQRLRR